MGQRAMTRFRYRLAALTVSVLMAAGGLIAMAVPATAAACGTGGTTWQRGTESGGVQVLDNANNWNGGDACLTIGANGTDFTIQSQTINSVPGGNPVGFPDTNIGCEGGFCTSTTNQRQALPGAYASISPKVTATWTGSAPTARYDELIDSAWSTDCSGSTRPPVTASVGIYLNYVPSASNLGLPNSGAKVTIAGMQWWTGQSIHHGATLTQFVAVHPVNSVSQLDLSGFYEWAHNHQNYLPTGDCLTDLGVGIEPWSALPPNTLGVSGVLLDS
jgi:hypothetical protein